MNTRTELLQASITIAIHPIAAFVAPRLSVAEHVDCFPTRPWLRCTHRKEKSLGRMLREFPHRAEYRMHKMVKNPQRI